MYIKGNKIELDEIDMLRLYRRLDSIFANKKYMRAVESKLPTPPDADYAVEYTVETGNFLDASITILGK